MRVGIKTSISKPVDQTPNTGGATVADMGIDHRCFDILVAEKLLGRSNIVAALKQI
jgi:hypothetical protein